MAMARPPSPTPSDSGGGNQEAVGALINHTPALAPLSALPAAVRTRLTLLARERTFPPGGTLLRSGEPADCVYFLLHGTVRVERAGADPGVAIEVGPGAVLGAAPGHRLLATRAIGEVTVLALSHLALGLTLLQFPEAETALRRVFQA